MTQIDFYIITGDSDVSRLRLACRITEKAVNHGQQVYLNSATEADARKLDELLWTFSQGSFIPHRVVSETLEDTPDEPVLIGFQGGADSEGASENWDFMINLATEVPEHFSRYVRVAEVVDANPQRREEGRERYRFYRDRGYELKTHKV